MKYRYYSTQRPIDIGTYPKLPDAPAVNMTFFSERKLVENGTVLAWGVLAYNAGLMISLKLWGQRVNLARLVSQRLTAAAGYPWKP